MSKQCQVFLNYCVQVIYGNEFTTGVPHSAIVSCYCCSCTKSRPFTAIVSIEVLFSCTSHCLTVMQPHLSTLHLHSLLCAKRPYFNCYVLLEFILCLLIKWTLKARNCPNHSWFKSSGNDWQFSARQGCLLIHTHQSHHYVRKQCRVGGECCQSSPGGKSF